MITFSLVVSTDHNAEVVRSLHRQLPDAPPLLLESGLGLLPDFRHRRREAQLQDHCAARRHGDAASSQ